MQTSSVGKGGQCLTTDPVRATPAYVAGQDPEWLDAVGVKARYSIKYSLLWELDRDGLVESVSLRRPGRQRGKRLYSVSSIREYLSSLRTNTNAAYKNGGGT